MAYTAIIYDGFWKNSISVTVRVPGVVPGTLVLIYDEDNLQLLGQATAASEDILVPVVPISSRRIIAFTGEFGQGTAGGVDVIISFNGLTGWLTPEPVNAESVPEEIGLFNPGSEHPLTARYDPDLLNIIASKYYAASIALISEPIGFDTVITYRVNSGTSIKEAFVEVRNVKNARGSFTINIGGIVGANRTFTTDQTFNIVVTDSEGRILTRSITVNPATTYMPVAPTPPVSIISQSFVQTYRESDMNVLRAQAQCPDELEVQFRSDIGYEKMYQSSTNTWTASRKGIPPGLAVVTIRIKSSPTDYIVTELTVP